VKNEFLLHLQSGNIEKADISFLDLIKSEEMNIDLLSRKIFKEENKAAYRIKISAYSLILFKKKIDEMINYESLQLFKYVEW
jgi:hypothetical protein